MTEAFLPPAGREIRAAVFDLDGTLYSQPRLRAWMGLLLLAQAATPAGRRTVRVLRRFRRHREHLARLEADAAASRQYEDVAAALDLSAAEVAGIVQRWLFIRPLAILPRLVFPAARPLLEALAARGIRVAVLSDYPPGEKLRCLGLSANAAVCTLDTPSSRLKPHPGPLLDLLEQLGVEPAQALVVGDRRDRDGEAARRAGCLFHFSNSNAGLRVLHRWASR